MTNTFNHKQRGPKFLFMLFYVWTIFCNKKKAQPTPKALQSVPPSFLPPLCFVLGFITNTTESNQLWNSYFFLRIAAHLWQGLAPVMGEVVIISFVSLVYFSYKPLLICDNIFHCLFLQKFMQEEEDVPYISFFFL